MQIVDKAHILSDLWSTMREHEPWFPFFRQHEDGLSLAHYIDHNAILVLSSDGENSIDNAYADLCKLMHVPTSIDFDSLNDFFDYAVLNDPQRKDAQ